MKRSPKLPPIRVVRERVDGELCAVLAFCFRVSRGRYYDKEANVTITRPVLYGLSVFALVPFADGRRRDWNAIGRQRLTAELGQRERLPRVGWCDDVVGWSDYQ